MSFDVKNIESENIDANAVFQVILVFIFLIVGSLVFVYYYFLFEKENIMNSQYLEAPSKVRENYYKNENQKLKQLNIEESMDKIINSYD